VLAKLQKMVVDDVMLPFGELNVEIYIEQVKE
jgi:hypothetical protein